MCTLTWRAAEEGGYDLFFNRDERNERAPEHPPERGVSEAGVAYVAPKDGDHGGTWLVLNQHGLTVALLNYYPRGSVEAGTISRGRLPLACAACVRSGDVANVLRGIRLDEFAPFHLVAVDVGAGGVHLRWDGRALHEAPAPEFLTSSSFEPERVQAARAGRFDAWRGCTSEDLAAFHQHHDPEAGAESVRMLRPDACTRSVCAVHVRPSGRELVYETVDWERGAAKNPVVARL